MDFFSHKSKIDFLARTNLALLLSACFIIATVMIWVARGNDKYGIDFRGGYEVKVKFSAPADGETIRRGLDHQGLEGVTVQALEANAEDFSIRFGLLEELNSKEVMNKVQAALDESYSGKFEITESNSVGATIGKELKQRALWATLLGVVGVLIYMAFRFEFSYSLGAVAAMFHDVIVATGVYLLAGYDLNGSALAAALTIVGYSVNDTIVVFDRVREETHKRKNYVLRDVINECNNACLSRTVLTHVLTLFAVGALFVYGGGAIKDLSLFLLAGMISGVYSTIYIAAPVALLWESFRAKIA